MFREQGHPGEGFAAGGTGILFHVGMRLEMSTQVGAIGERPVAVGAGERFLAGVGAYVALKEPRSREGFAADRALARQRVRSDVHFQGAQGNVHFFTVFATERFSGAFTGGTMKLAVFR